MGRDHLSIGEVLALIKGDFPDVTVSKIRFLEGQGLLEPERTPSGYRKFYDHDLERLRWILVQQRDHFLPLKVIKARLDGEGVEVANSSAGDQIELPLGDLAPLIDAPPAAPPTSPSDVDLEDEDVLDADALDVVAPGLNSDELETADSSALVASSATMSTKRVGSAPTPQRSNGEGIDVDRPDPGAWLADLAAGRTKQPATINEPGGSDVGSSSAAMSSADIDLVAEERVAAHERSTSGQSHSTIDGGLDSDSDRTPTTAAHDKSDLDSAVADPAPGDDGRLVEADHAAATDQDADGMTDTDGTTHNDGTSDTGIIVTNVDQRGAASSSAPETVAEDNDPSVAADDDPEALVGVDDNDSELVVTATDSETTADGDDVDAVSDLDAPDETGSWLDLDRDDVALTRAELAEVSGMPEPALADLEHYGLISTRRSGPVEVYGQTSLQVAVRAKAFHDKGLEARHLRMFLVSAEREAAFLENIVAPLLHRRNDGGRAEAVEILDELGLAGLHLRDALLRGLLETYLSTS